MGLAIEVGSLAFLKTADAEGYEWTRQELAAVNTVLAEAGLPQHTEPDELPELASRAGLTSFPYSFLHYLRRVYANLDKNPQWRPVEVAEGDDPTKDPAIDHQLFVKMTSHLVCHSDAEGFYVPVDLAEPLVDDRLTGGILGSSQALQRELILIAPALGIKLTDGQLSDAEAERISDAADEDAPWERELTVWIALYEAARLSIAHNTVIKFT
jgi:hypothetical protein